MLRQTVLLVLSATGLGASGASSKAQECPPVVQSNLCPQVVTQNLCVQETVCVPVTQRVGIFGFRSVTRMESRTVTRDAPVMSSSSVSQQDLVNLRNELQTLLQFKQSVEKAAREKNELDSKIKELDQKKVDKP